MGKVGTNRVSGGPVPTPSTIPVRRYSVPNPSIICCPSAPTPSTCRPSASTVPTSPTTPDPPDASTSTIESSLPAGVAESALKNATINGYSYSLTTLDLQKEQEAFRAGEGVSTPVCSQSFNYDTYFYINYLDKRIGEGLWCFCPVC